MPVVLAKARVKDADIAGSDLAVASDPLADKPDNDINLFLAAFSADNPTAKPPALLERLTAVQH